ncbi:MAG: Flp pilus assembly complex ATPase component TadA, partial [Desulfamplus sp.]|nr:Flp pilus assembly complex ATPase component TadA [Desulfamplus sp.]
KSNTETLSEKHDTETYPQSPIDNNTDENVMLFVNEMIIQACKRNASHIHIELHTNPSYISKDFDNAEIRFRIDGICQPYTEIPNKLALNVIFRIKVMAKMDITLRAKPLDGKIKFKSTQTDTVILQVVTVPTIGYKEDMVLKLLKNTELLSLPALGFLNYNLDPFIKMLHKSSGLILVSGNADSGKTTTLHSSLKLVNTPEKKIFSVENPVEIHQKGIRQTEIQTQMGLDYPILLRAFIKADPDVILLGEMMDYETATLATKAALTGHLVLAEFDSQNLSDTVRRILEMGLNPIHFADALNCILTQRLVRRLCEQCRKPSSYTVDMLIDEFGKSPCGLMDAMDKNNMSKINNIDNDNKAKHSIVLYDSDPFGCNYCGHTGYKGRIAIHELLINSNAIKHLIKEVAVIETAKDGGKSKQSMFKKIDDAVKNLKNSAVKGGMYSLKQDGLLKVVAGITDMSEINRKCLC